MNNLPKFQEEYSAKLPALTLLSNLGWSFLSAKICCSALPNNCGSSPKPAFGTQLSKSTRLKINNLTSIQTVNLNVTGNITYTTHNTATTLSARKGNAQPWWLFYFCPEKCHG